MFFSVIVTVFNGGAFLSSCLDSILINPAGNYELILVDDGSIDITGQICDNYADRFGHVSCVHTHNQGVGKARQVGLERASGKFVIFVDGDDLWDESFCLRTLEDEINNNDADLYIFGFVQRIINQTVFHDLRFKVGIETFDDWRDNQSQFLSYFSNGLMFPCWNKIFKRQCIIDHSLAFVHQQMEDFRFVLDYLNVTKSVVFMSKEPYIYFKREKQGLTSFAHPGMLEGYNYCHSLFLSLFEVNYTGEINKIMAPQYIGTAYKCLNLEDRSLALTILNSLQRSRFAQLSLKDYQPTSLSDRLSVFMIQKRLWNTLSHYRKMVTVLKRWLRK